MAEQLRRVDTPLGVIEYTLERKRVKNINLRVCRDASVAVSANTSVSAEYIDEFVISRAEFIMNAITRRKNEVPDDLSDGGEVTILGERLPVKCTAGRVSRAVIKNGVVEITLANGDEPEKPFRRLLEREARREYFDSFNRIYPLVEPLGVRVPAIHIKDMRSRWGSCTPAKGVVALSLALVKHDRECIDYVMLHELCHFLYSNHGAEFHALMNRLMPDCEARRKRLNEM